MSVAKESSRPQVDARFDFGEMFKGKGGGSVAPVGVADQPVGSNEQGFISTKQLARARTRIYHLFPIL